jgi:hypothetical protein
LLSLGSTVNARYKAEVVRTEGKKPKDNSRFVVTNIKQSPQWLYEEVYCQ